jgi:hypothetical protein
VIAFRKPPLAAFLFEGNDVMPTDPSARKAKKILLIADYGRDDLAFKEVQQRLYELAGKANQNIQVDIATVDPFNAPQTAAMVAQAAEEGYYDVIYHNTAPRKDVAKERPDNDGEPLAYAKYQNAAGKETRIVGVFAGDDTVNTFALLDKAHLHNNAVYEINCPRNGSQFRSRDVFPPHVINAVTNSIELTGILDVPAIAKPDQVASAKAFAREALKQPQYVSHGDCRSNYLTVIAPEDKCANEISHVRGYDAFTTAQIDAIPLRFKNQQWIEAGFVAAQLALNSQDGKKRTIKIAINDPRDKQGFFAELDNGAVINTDKLEALYFVRPRIKNLLRVWETGDSASLTPKQQEHLDTLTLPQEITPVYVDGYGNIKLSNTHQAIKERLECGKSLEKGEVLTAAVRVNGREIEAFLSGGSFKVRDGEAALSKGSSGWATNTSLDPKDKHYFTEVFRRGGNAASELGNPQPGDYISISVKDRKAGVPGTVVEGSTRQVTDNAASRQTGATP